MFAMCNVQKVVLMVLTTTFLLQHYVLSDTVIRTCEPIRVEMCRSVGYNNTSMPNLVGHELQSDADFTLQTFTPLIQYGCSAQLHFFLCAAYFPYCTPKVPEPIGPCRALCEAVRSRCHPVLQGFGFPWPHALDCDRFPKANNLDSMCMKGPDEPTGASISTDYLPTKATSSLQPSCQNLAKSHLYVRLNRSGKCAPLCEAEIMFNAQDKNIAELWVSVWSFATIVIAVAAILSFIISDTKWDKILMPLVTCNSLVAVGWVVRILAGRNNSSCGIDPQLPGTYILLTDGLSYAPCATTFLLRYYFGMSASVWWAILCLKWHFTVRRERDDSLSGSTVDKKYDDTYSSVTQLTAWGLPAIQTLLVLVTRLVDADELIEKSSAPSATITKEQFLNQNGIDEMPAGKTVAISEDVFVVPSNSTQRNAFNIRNIEYDVEGACYVGNQSDQALRNYVATPLFGYWVFGAVNLLAGYLVQRRTVNAVPHRSHIQPKNVNGMNGMGSFLFIIACCIGLLMIAVFYEFANIDIWLHQPQSHGESTTTTQTVPMWSFMLRAYMELLAGVICCGWTLGPRFSNLWKNRFCLRPVERKLPTVNYPQSSFSSASYQTVCPQNSMISLSTKAGNVRRYQPPMHIYRKVRVYKSPSQSISLTGNETVL